MATASNSEASKVPLYDTVKVRIVDGGSQPTEAALAQVAKIGGQIWVNSATGNALHLVDVVER